MAKIIHRLLLIKLFLSIHLLISANALIGDKVKPAKNHEFPFVISLGIAPANKITEHFCTGTLISKNHVLTSAHCVQVSEITHNFMTPAKIVVTVGTNDVTQGIKHKVKSWMSFDEWAEKKKIKISRSVELYHDIAVITLIDEVNGTKPAVVSDLNYKQIVGKPATIAGWGMTNLGVRPRFLQKAKIHVLKRKACLRNLKIVELMPEDVLNHLCTVGKPPISLGCGDSGGPLLINGDEIVGVNESDCANHDDPHQQNLHTSVKFYRKFIMEVAGLKK